MHLLDVIEEKGYYEAILGWVLCDDCGGGG